MIFISFQFYHTEIQGQTDGVDRRPRQPASFDRCGERQSGCDPHAAEVFSRGLALSPRIDYAVQTLHEGECLTRINR